MQLFRETNVDFLGKKKIAATVSGILILAGIISLIAHGGPQYGIDFTGGTSLELAFEKPMTAGDLRNSLSGLGFGQAEIKKIGFEEDNLFLIRVEKQAEGENIAEIMEGKLTADFPDNKYDIRSVTEIGPKIGGELRKAALLAVFISLIGILIYISWRFEFKFAVGAVVALFHDVLVTLGFFSLLNLDITLVIVAAFLTIVGYSLNDTIVIYDRIRENLKILRRDAFESVINKSINQTLSRTIITSGTTLIVVVVLFFMGGEVIHDFSFALLVGIVAGTYSTIFIASPVVIALQSRFQGQKGKRRM
jgi:preprotein translocase subunit SecF